MSINAKHEAFYCDYGTSVVAVRCGSDHAVVEEFDLNMGGKFLAEKMCKLLNREAEALKAQTKASRSAPADGANERRKVKHCGKENCAGASCYNWPKCRGETIPPWDCGPHQTTSKATIREQDILTAADRLAECANAYHEQNDDVRWMRLHYAIHAYNKARKGES